MYQMDIVKAVSGARSVKILLVISKGDIGGRMTGMKNLADTVAKLIPNCGAYYKNLGVVPVFTHMQNTDGKTLKKMFLNHTKKVINMIIINVIQRVFLDGSIGGEKT